MPDSTNLKPWQILSSKIVHKTPWIEIVADQCLVDGKELTYTYTRRVDEGPLIIAEENDGRIWMVRQYRHPIKKIVWQFPVEGKFPEETWEQAAVRGLQEEVHRDATTWSDLGLFYPDPGGLDQRVHVFVATGLSKTAVPTDHDGGEVENLEIACFSRAEIDKLIKSGEICDNWTLGGLFLYERYTLNR
jgi:8-oxo-dGTP pyrophosphatase MutT (NUDIX family)